MFNIYNKNVNYYGILAILPEDFSLRSDKLFKMHLFTIQSQNATRLLHFTLKVQKIIRSEADQ